MLTVMVDNCIMSLSETMQCVLKPVKAPFGDIAQWVDVLGFERVPAPGENENWKLEQLKCLPTIARLARESEVICHTYSELRYEEWRRTGSFPGIPIGRLFADVDFTEVDAAVERSYFFQGDIEDAVSNRKRIDFCKWLLSVGFELHIDRLSGTGRYPDFLIENLRRVDRFRELSADLGDGQLVDAFHLWTAETNGIAYFLTTDLRFINAITESKRMDLECRPISPAQLLDLAGVTDRDPFPHAESGTIDIFGNPL